MIGQEEYGEEEPIYISPREQKYWALKKWRAYYYGYDLPPELKEFYADCAYCEPRRIVIACEDIIDCETCPIAIKQKPCRAYGSDYWGWQEAMRLMDNNLSPKENSKYHPDTKKMLDLILSIDPGDEPRFYRGES
jgi:hypothetical protein